MARETPYRVITALLRAFGTQVPAISWGSSASPFYKAAPEPPPAFPYVVYDMPVSSIEHSTDDGPSGSIYAEKRTLDLKVIGDSDEIEQIAAPEWSNSLCNYLDSLASTPNFLNGQGFDCVEFLRVGYELVLEPSRDPDGVTRIWAAHATYDYWTTVPYPTRRL